MNILSRCLRAFIRSESTEIPLLHSRQKTALQVVNLQGRFKKESLRDIPSLESVLWYITFTTIARVLSLSPNKINAII